MFKKNVDFGFDINWDRLPDSDHFKKAMTFVNANLQDHRRKDLYVINGLPFYFDPSDKTIGITFSGGADSTMIFYMLCRLIESLGADTKIVAATVIRGWDVKPWLEDITADIISYLDKRFPNIQKEQVFGFLPPAFEVTPLKNIVGAEGMFSKDIVDTAYADIYCVMSYTKYINAKYKIERTYSGITMNPELDHPELNSPSFRDTREFNENDLSSFRGPGPNMRPFEMLYKNWVMAQYENFNIQELRELTRSCNTALIELNIPNVENIKILGSEYACQTCFFCEERRWGHDNRHLYLEDYHK
jgi:hypothetical protein